MFARPSPKSTILVQALAAHSIGKKRLRLFSGAFRVPGEQFLAPAYRTAQDPISSNGNYNY